MSTSWYDKVYFSTNNTWEAADPAVASESVSLTLAPGSNYTRTASFTLPNVPESRYWLVLRVDTSNAINETNETNNELIIPIDIVGSGSHGRGLQSVEWRAGGGIR